MLKNARFLIELDISDNRMTTHALVELSRAIAENKQLQVINLSLNFFTSSQSMNDYMPGIAEINQSTEE